VPIQTTSTSYHADDLVPVVRHARHAVLFRELAGGERVAVADGHDLHVVQLGQAGMCRCRTMEPAPMIAMLSLSMWVG